jgi:Lysine-specific metallo-endopeptidase
MANRNFLEKVFNKAKAVLVTQSFDDELQKFLTATATSQTGIVLFRNMITAARKKSGMSLEEVIVSEAKKGEPFSKWNSRAAFLKLLMHFSRHSKRGAQDVWIYSPPKEYTKWIFEEISGTENRVQRKLQKCEEVYSEAEKDVMVDALQLALACSQKAEYLLVAASEETQKIVRRWFGTEQSSTEDIKKVTEKLAHGFKRVTNVCNANNLIFADDPGDRKSMAEYEDLYASIWRGGEGNIKVMYIAGNFKRAGNSGQLWLCALTIIHEATHLELDTKDMRVDRQGLKPGSAFSPSDALRNADSWGYFCIDLCGYLSQADMKNVFR